LSYEGADFQLIEGVMDEHVRVAYEMGTKVFTDLLFLLEMHVLPAKGELDDARLTRERLEARGGDPQYNEVLDDIYADSDSDYDDELDVERTERRKNRERKRKSTKALFFGSHLRFFQALCKLMLANGGRHKRSYCTNARFRTRRIPLGQLSRPIPTPPLSRFASLNRRCLR
jgi:hypothetical protein